MDFELEFSGITLKHGLILAPMAGITDLPFRTLCTEQGADMTVSEMISAKGVYYGDKKSTVLSASSEIEKNFSVQIFGSDPDIMAFAACKLKEYNNNIKAFDINMGCPMPKIAGNGEGSALMKNPLLAGKIVRKIKDSVKIPVSVKMRTGWDENSINAPELAKICEDNGCDLICVHGRTKEQLYQPPVDFKTIAKVKKAVKIPVIANGGIYSYDDYKNLLEKTECDGCAIAQGAMGNPFIFKEIICKSQNIPYEKPSVPEIIDTAVRHIDMLCKVKGDYLGVRESRKHLGWYIKGMKGAAETRNRINSAQDKETLCKIMKNLINI